jgi:hypothetical protein
MPSSTRVRDWATVDFYRVLGITPEASAEEIARAFRSRAKELHPDARVDDPDPSDAFQALAAAYSVLGNPPLRRDYDRVRYSVARPAVAVRATGPSRSAPTATAVRKPPWSARRSLAALLCGLAVFVFGVFAAAGTWYLHVRDANERARFTPVTAVRIDVNGHADVRFRTTDGRVVQTAEPQHHGDPAPPGQTVKIRYDPKDPRRVVPDDSTFGRDITLAVVALKLLVGGAVFVGLGWYRRRAALQRAATGAR